MEAACPGARIFNYTNPVNIVAQAVTDHSDVPIVSLCEGPIFFPRESREAAGLDPDGSTSRASGSTTASWTRAPPYDGAGLCRCSRTAWERRADDPELRPQTRRHAAAGRRDGLAPERVLPVLLLRGRGPAPSCRPSRRPAPRTSSAGCRTTGRHYEEQAAQDAPSSTRRARAAASTSSSWRSTCMDAVFNDRGETLPVNVPNAGSVPGFPDSLVVETLGRCDREGVHPLPMPGLPATCRGWSRRWPLPAGGGRRGWSGDAARRRAGAVVAPARALDRPRRAALRGVGRGAPGAAAGAAGPSLRSAGGPGRAGPDRVASRA